MAYNSYRPSQSSTPVVLNLIIINAIVFVAQMVFDKTGGLKRMDWLHQQAWRFILMIVAFLSLINW